MESGSDESNYESNESASEMDTDDNASEVSETSEDVSTPLTNKSDTHLHALEKVIICIDQFMCQKKFLQKLQFTLSQFTKTKKYISTKKVEFSFVIYNRNRAGIRHFSSLDILGNFVDFKKNDATLLDLSDLFNNLAKFSYPNPLLHGYGIEPPFVTHLIILYGSHDSVPVLNSPNSYKFLVSNPFVIIDILHLTNPNSTLTVSIGKILQCLVSPNKGYFQQSNSHHFTRNLIKFVGNPFLR